MAACQLSDAWSAKARLPMLPGRAGGRQRSEGGQRV